MSIAHNKILLFSIFALIFFVFCIPVNSPQGNKADLSAVALAQADEGQVSIDIDYIVDPTAWLTGWAHRKKITVDNANVDADLSNFPLLVSFTADADLATALATGNDIRFTDSGGRSTLYYEKESWTGGGGASATANFWVKVPTVTHSASTVIYIYYGNSGASDGQSATNVWDSNFKGVWHLKEATGVNDADSTSNANTGTPTNGPVQATGYVDGSLSFDGTDDYVSYSGIPTTVINNWTMSAWVNPASINQQGTMVSNGYDNNAVGDGYAFGIGNAAGGAGDKLYGVQGGVAFRDSGYTFGAENQWYFITMQNTAGTTKFFVNGIQTANTFAITYLTPTLFRVGSHTGVRFFNGSIDECRISSTARSADWIKFEYHNQGDSGNNLTYGTQENNVVWLAGWSNRKKITIDHAKVGATTEDETNFPVLISLTGLSGINTNGTDIRFTTSDGGTYLAREIESYSAGALTAWVKIPTLSHTTDTSIYMYYGNSGASEPAVDSTYGSQNVWDTNYKAVYHLKETTDATVNDSTANANNSTSQTWTQAVGKVDGSGSFNGTNNVAVAPISALGTADYTLTIWVKKTAAGTTIRAFTPSEDVSSSMSFPVVRYNANEVVVQRGAGGQYQFTSGGFVDDTNWHLISVVRNSGSVAAYFDGGTAMTSTPSGSDYDQNGYDFTGTTFTLGRLIFNNTSYYTAAGTMDEPRISDVARSAGWISTEYNNQNSPGTFYTAGNTEGTEVPQNWLTGWTSRKKITIKHASVDETLSNFPLLVKFASNADLAGALATGNDIRFTQADGTTLLSYEKESWTGGNGTSATANFWVKIPSISTTADTDIYMYYGNSSASDGQSATSVWDSNFKGVWHLGDSASPALDSTSNNNDGTQSGGVTFGATGKIDGATSYAGDDDYVSVGTDSSLNLTGNTFTASTWIYPTSNVNNAIFIKGNSSTAGYILQTWSDGKIYASFGDGAQKQVNSGATTQTLNAWQLVTAVYNGTTLKVYKNGIEVGTADYSTNISGTSNTAMIGWDTAAEHYFTGSLDETRISSTARSASWIKFEYANQASADNELIIEGYTNTTPGEIVWTNGSGDNLWSTAGNWQGGVVPGTGDIAQFDSSASTGNATIDATASVKGLSIASGYTGTITQNTGIALTIGTSGFTQASGATFVSSSGGITNSGNWSNSGTFTAGTGTVTLNGTNQTLSGSTTFYNLTKSVASADTLTFTAGTTQTIAAGGTLTLRGASGQLLTLASSAASTSTIAFADATAKYVVDYVSVSYNTATGLGIIALNSTNGNNNSGWTFPTTSGTARYWIATGTANWNDTANWSTTSGGSGGSSVPVSTDDAIFDGAKNGDVTINATVNVKGFIISGYSGTITSGANTVTVGTDGFIQSSGTFTAPSTTLTVSGNFTRTGGTFTHNSGTVNFTTSPANITSGGATFNNVTINTGWQNQITLIDDIDINGNLTFGNSQYTGAVYASGTRNVNVAGNITFTSGGGLGGGGTLNLILDGSSDQTIGSNITANLTIDKTSGSALLGGNLNLGASSTLTINSGNTVDSSPNYNLTVGSVFTNDGTFYGRAGTHSFGSIASSGTFSGGSGTTTDSGALQITAGAFTSTSGTLSIAGNFTNSGGTFTHNSGTVNFNGNNASITTGGATFNNVKINSDWHNDTTLIDNMDINGNLTFGDVYSGVLVPSGTRTINLAGNYTKVNAGSLSGATLTLILDGGSDQTINTDSISSNLTIAKSAGSAVLGSAFTVTGGTTTINASNTLNLAGYNFTSATGFVNNGTLQLQGGETVTTPTLNLGSTVEYTATSGTRALKSWTYTNATVKINGSGGTFTLPANTTASAVNVTAGTLDLAGFNLTANPITLTGTLKLKGSETISSTPTINTGSIVTFDGHTSAVTIPNWSYKTLTMNAPAKTFNFTAGANYTVDTAWNVNGTAGNFVTLRSTVTDTQWNIAVPATHSLSYIDVKDSNNTGTVIDATNISLFTDSDNNDGWNFNTSPTLTSIADSPDPIKGLSTITITPTGQGDGELDTLKYYCAESTAPASSNTLCSQANASYTTPYSTMTCTYAVATGNETRTVYCRTYDGTVYSTEQTTTYLVDSTTPTTTDNYGAKDDVWQNTSQTITLTPTDASPSSGFAYTKYCTDTTNTCTVSSGTAYTVPVVISTEGTSYFRYASQDSAGNTQTTVSKTVKIDTTAPTTVADAGTYTFDDWAFSSVLVTLACADGAGSQCLATYYCVGAQDCTPSTPYQTAVSVSTAGTSYIRYYSTDTVANAETTKSQTIKISGGPMPNQPAPTPTPAENPNVQTPNPNQIPNPTIIQQITDVISNLKFQISNSPQGAYPPIAQSVPTEPQIVFQGGNIISQRQFDRINILPLPEAIKELALKFPKFASTLEKVGISKPEDVARLRVAQLIFPSLSEVAGAPAGFAFSKFTEEQKQKIPSNITFARTGADNIDFNIKVSVSDLNKPIQSIATIQGKPLYLTVKPDNPAESVKGYIIFKSANSSTAFLDWTSKLSAGLSASLLDATNFIKTEKPSSDLPEVTAQKDIVLSQFDYVNEGGIWTAKINAPAVDGKYEVRTVVQYENITPDNKSSETLSMILVVDPEGYIYEKTFNNKETRIDGALVSIYWLNPNTKQYELWPAKDFQQENPHTTDITGKYSFLVPPGTYYLQVESPDYLAYKGSPFQVQEGGGIHQNIELKAKNWFWRVFTVERILLGFIVILLLVIIIIFIKRKK